MLKVRYGFEMNFLVGWRGRQKNYCHQKKILQKESSDFLNTKLYSIWDVSGFPFHLQLE